MSVLEPIDNVAGCFVYCSKYVDHGRKLTKPENDGWPLSVGFCRQSLHKSLSCVPGAHVALGHGRPPPASRAPVPHRRWARPAQPARPTQPLQRIRRRPLGCVVHALEGATRAGTRAFLLLTSAKATFVLKLVCNASPLGLHGRTAGFDKLSNTPAQ